MNLLPALKLPFRIARLAWHAVRPPSPADDAPAPEPVRRPDSSSGASAPRTEPPPSPARAPAPAAARPAPAAPRTVAVRVESTPNPDARKFVCSITVMPTGSLAVNGPDEARGHAFAEALIAIEGVRTVFATKDFVTVTRVPDGPGWDALQPAVESALRGALSR